MGAAAIEPFFLAGAQSDLFAVFLPARREPPGELGALLFVHPFAEEMNKSRRMVALQARAFAAAGISVLLVDLHGCGDSHGDIGEADIEVWRADLTRAYQWLARRIDGRAAAGLWGLRCGALLAADLCPRLDPAPRELLLWQPTLTGKSVLTEFLRLRVAAELMSGGGVTTKDLRARLAAGETLEIAGYALNPRLARGLDGLTLQACPVKTRVHWLEVLAEEGRSIPPGSRRVIDAWTRTQAEITAIAVAGEQFWRTQEITECPELLAATTKLFPLREGHTYVTN